MFLAIEGYKLSAEQHLSNVHLNRVTRSGTLVASEAEHDLETVREAARDLFDQYLSERATNRVEFDESFLRKLKKQIETSNEPSESLFDAVQTKV